MDDTRKQAIERWIRKAENDLRTCETMISVEPPVADTACFHAQQCVEKCLKAFLTAADRHVEKTHSLPRLVELCGEIDPGFEEMENTAIELTGYAVTGRYPDDYREIPIEEAQAAARMAAEAMTFAKKKIGCLTADD